MDHIQSDFHRIATRYDKLAGNYLAAFERVAGRIWLPVKLAQKLVKP